MVKRRFLTLILVSLLLGAMLLGSATSSVIAEETVIHKVKWGETLSWISWMYGVTIQDIVDANGLSSSHWIYAGQELVIPIVEEYVEHEVQAGETLLGIAAQYNVSVWDIARRNGLWNTNLIYVGQVLIIPLGTEPPPEPEPEPEPGDVQEAIIISSPTLNEEVTSPVTVTGWGSGFENNLAVDVLDATGSVIGQGYVIVDAELGQIGPFTGSIAFTPPASAQLGRVSVYSISPRDGAIEHLASVTVNLNP